MPPRSTFKHVRGSSLLEEAVMVLVSLAVGKAAVTQFLNVTPQDPMLLIHKVVMLVESDKRQRSQQNCNSAEYIFLYNFKSGTKPQEC